MAKPRAIPSDAADLLAYDAMTGRLTRRVRTSNRIKVGDDAGAVGSAGYVNVRLHGRLYLAHRIAWFLHYGEDPGERLDHRNGDRADNRISNLRKADKTQNRANSRGWAQSGLKGVQSLKSGRYSAVIRVRGETTYLGSFDTAELAHAAYAAEASKRFGEFARAA